MPRALFSVLALAGIVALTGCAQIQKCGGFGKKACSVAGDCGSYTDTCAGDCGGGCGGSCGDSCNIFSGCGITDCCGSASGCGRGKGCGLFGKGCGARGMGCGLLGWGCGPLGLGSRYGAGNQIPRGWNSQQAMMSGPASGAITYPYYTVRGPRDFLAADPRPIGP